MLILVHIAICCTTVRNCQFLSSAKLYRKFFPKVQMVAFDLYTHNTLFYRRLVCCRVDCFYWLLQLQVAVKTAVGATCCGQSTNQMPQIPLASFVSNRFTALFSWTFLLVSDCSKSILLKQKFGNIETDCFYFSLPSALNRIYNLSFILFDFLSFPNSP